MLIRSDGSGASYSRCISGAFLARCLRHMTPAQRAVLAAEIIEGRAILQGLTVKTVTALTGVSQPYVNIALRLTSEERVAVASGKRPMVLPRARPVSPVVDDCWWLIDDDVLAEAIQRSEVLDTFSTAVEVESR
jgi:hypothetical protein